MPLPATFDKLCNKRFIKGKHFLNHIATGENIDFHIAMWLPM